MRQDGRGVRDPHPPEAANGAPAGEPAHIVIAESGSGYGGTARYLTDLIAQLDRRRYRVSVVISEEGPLLTSARAQGVPVFRRPAWRFPWTVATIHTPVRIVDFTWFGLWMFIQTIWTVPPSWAWLRRQRVEIVHVNNEILSHTMLLLAARLAGCRTVCHLHGWRPLTRLERWAAQFVDVFICISHAGAEYHRQQLDGREVLAVPHGVPFSREVSSEMLPQTRAAGRAQLGLAPGDVAVAIVGRLVPWKGQTIFLHALAKVIAEHPEVQGFIVGHDPSPGQQYAGLLRTLAQQLGVSSRVRFVPWQQDVWSIYAAADVIVHASTDPEPFGLVIIEAMAAGRPVIATRAGGVVDIVQDGRTGLLVRPGDIDELAAAIRRLCTDRALANRLAEAGRRRAHDVFTMPRNVAAVSQVYDQLLGRATPASLPAESPAWTDGVALEAAPVTEPRAPERPLAVADPAHPRLRVLLLDHGMPFSPYSGKSVRLLNLLKRLSRHHELHYVTLVGPRDARAVPDWLQPVVASVRVLRREETEFAPGRVANWVMIQPYFYAPWRHPADYQRISTELVRLVQHESIDLVHCFDEEAAQYLPTSLPCPWIADPADAMALHAHRRAEHASALGDRMQWQLTAWRLQRYERQLLARAAATVYVSPVDAAFHRAAAPEERIHVIPNGVDTDYFSPQADFERPIALPGPRLVLTGHMRFAPNHHAALHLIDRILPIVRQSVAHVACDLVGADPRPELMARHDGRRVTVTGWVPDLRPWIAEGTVYVCPMVLGAGIKNKLLEAMAMGKAIVTTARGADGIDVRDGEHVIMAEEEADFAARIVELLRDTPRREALGRAARELVVQRYSWDAAARAYQALYERVRTRAPRPSPEASPRSGAAA